MVNHRQLYSLNWELYQLKYTVLIQLQIILIKAIKIMMILMAIPIKSNTFINIFSSNNYTTQVNDISNDYSGNYNN